MDDKQLPAEVLAEVNEFVKDKINIEREYWNSNPSADHDRAKTYVAGYGKGISAGATEYANKLRQAESEIEDKANEIERLRRIVSKHKSGRTYQEQKSAIENMRALLEKFISRHEAGLLPDRFIYDEIKTYLDGK